MSMLKYIFFSSLEYLSSFVFILIQFRFSLKENLSQILLISLLLSFVSYSFINADLNGLFPIVQLLIGLTYIQMVMKINVFNALIMFFTGYIVFGLVQTCTIAVAMHLEFVHAKVAAGTNSAFGLHFASSLFMLLLSLLTYRLKGGFSFIEARSRFSKKMFTGKNRLFISFIMLAFVITMIANVMILNDHPPYLWIASILLVVLVALIYMSIRRDEVID